jgi:hypothetical protein
VCDNVLDQEGDAPHSPGERDRSSDPERKARRPSANRGCCGLAALYALVGVGYFVYLLSVPYDYRAIRWHKRWFRNAAEAAISSRKPRQETLSERPFWAAQLLEIKVVEDVCRRPEDRAVLFVFVENLSDYDPYVAVVPTGELDRRKWLDRFGPGYLGGILSEVADGIWYVRAEYGYANENPDGD